MNMTAEELITFVKFELGTIVHYAEKGEDIRIPLYVLNSIVQDWQPLQPRLPIQEQVTPLVASAVLEQMDQQAGEDVDLEGV